MKRLYYTIFDVPILKKNLVIFQYTGILYHLLFLGKVFPRFLISIGF